MGYICYLGRFIEPSKSLGGKYEPSEKFRGQKQTLFFMMFPRQVNKSAYSRQFLIKLKKDICIRLNLPVPMRIDAPKERIAVHTNQVSPAK
jgi:hypothetical protein